MTEQRLMLTAEEAADVTGYRTAARFCRAVMRGEMPHPHAAGARPQLWSRAAIEAMLNPAGNREHFDPRVIALEKRWRM
jgi:hypothetical protein